MLASDGIMATAAACFQRRVAAGDCASCCCMGARQQPAH